MAGIAFLRLLPKRVCIAPSFTIWGRLGCRSFCSIKRDELTERFILKNSWFENLGDVKGEMKKKLTFQEFKKTEVEKLEEFLNSPAIQYLCKGDLTKAKKSI